MGEKRARDILYSPGPEPKMGWPGGRKPPPIVAQARQQPRQSPSAQPADWFPPNGLGVVRIEVQAVKPKRGPPAVTGAREVAADAAFGALRGAVEAEEGQEMQGALTGAAIEMGAGAAGRDLARGAGFPATPQGRITEDAIGHLKGQVMGDAARRGLAQASNGSPGTSYAPPGPSAPAAAPAETLDQRLQRETLEVYHPDWHLEQEARKRGPDFDRRSFEAVRRLNGPEWSKLEEELALSAELNRRKEAARRAAEARGVRPEEDPEYRHWDFYALGASQTVVKHWESMQAQGASSGRGPAPLPKR